MKFQSEYDTIEFRKKLNDLIETHRNDSFSSHIRNVVSNQNISISGMVTSNDFVMWYYNYFLADMFYSVFNGKIKTEGSSCFIELKSKLNLVGVVIVSLASLLLGYGILTGIIIQNDNSFKFIIWRLLAGIVLFSLFQTVPYTAYLISKRKTMKILTENLKLKKYTKASVEQLNPS